MLRYVDPQMRVILDEMQSGPAVDLKLLPIEQARLISDAASIEWGSGAPDLFTMNLELAGAAGPIPCCLYSPDHSRVLPVIVYVHGGGWTFGSIATHDATMRELAVASGAAVLGFNYRLAPEHPFPAALEDAVEVIEALTDARLADYIDADRWALSGDSAGATIALSAMILRRDENKTPPLAAALFYGCYFPDFKSESHQELGQGYLLTTVNMRWYWQNYIGDTFKNPDGLAAPLYADLRGLPAIYAAAAGLDPLRDDTIKLAAKLTVSDVELHFEHFPGVVHGCLRMSRRLTPAKAMLDSAGAFLRKKLAGPPKLQEGGFEQR